MNRREAVRRATFLLGGAITFSGFDVLGEVLSPVSGNTASLKTIASQEALIAQIADTIIPDTKGVPGAKAAGLGPFIIMMLEDCYTSDVQVHFAEGLMKVDKVSQNLFSKLFTELSMKQREEVFKFFKEEAQSQSTSGAIPAHFFQLMYELTFLGYYTSEIGATKALRYVHIPGRYESCIPLLPGQKAWAT